MKRLILGAIVGIAFMGLVANGFAGPDGPAENGYVIGVTGMT